MWKTSRVILFVSIGLPSTAVAQYSQPDEPQISLTCSGQGQRNQNNYVDRREYNWKKGKYQTRTEVEETTQVYNSMISIQIYGNQGRIRLAPTMIPPIHSGGDKQNWWQLKNVRVDEDEIHATYDLSGLNTAKLSIDRHTGDIKIKSLAPAYVGTCEKADFSQRRF